MTEREKMLAGMLYDPADEEIMSEQLTYKDKLYEYNHLRPSEAARRIQLMREMFAECGENNYFEAPLNANWGGHNVYLGSNIYANYNLTLVDDGRIYIGDWCKFGPNVTLATPGHPVLPELRRGRLLQFNKDIHIKDNVWIGAGAVVCPGVTIGENSVIGAGSVVTRDIPANVVAYGNPCRVKRKISRLDRERFFRDERIDWREIEKQDLR